MNSETILTLTEEEVTEALRGWLSDKGQCYDEDLGDNIKWPKKFGDPYIITMFGNIT